MPSALPALSQQTRRSIFRLLVKAGPDGGTAGEIAARLGALQNTMSSHRKGLAQEGSSGAVAAAGMSASGPITTPSGR